MSGSVLARSRNRQLMTAWSFRPEAPRLGSSVVTEASMASPGLRSEVDSTAPASPDRAGGKVKLSHLHRPQGPAAHQPAVSPARPTPAEGLCLICASPLPLRRQATGMGLGVIGEEGRVQSPLTRMIYMWHNLRCACLSRSRALSPPASLCSLLCAVPANSLAIFRSAAGMSWSYNDGSRGMSGDGRRASRRFA